MKIWLLASYAGVKVAKVASTVYQQTSQQPKPKMGTLKSVLGHNNLSLKWVLGKVFWVMKT